MRGPGNGHFSRRLFLAAGPAIAAAVFLFAAYGSAQAQAVGDFDLLIYDTRQGGTISVTDTPGFGEFNASFSPNGKTVVYELIDGTFSMPIYLALTDIDSGITVPLPGGEGGNDAVYSPNGQYIAFDRSNVNDLHIYTVPATGGTPTLVREWALTPTWSNNSRRIAFWDLFDWSINTIDLATGEETDLGAAGASGFAPNPAWSPNGQWIAFETDGNLRAVRVNEHGEPLGEAIIVTFGSSFDNQPSWSNNSKTLVFNSDRDSGEVDLWTVNIDEVETIECGVEDTGNDPAEAYGVPVFVRGSMNSWAATDASMFVNQGNDIYEAEILLPDGFSEFKVASADWIAVDFAPLNLVELGVPQVMVPAPGGPNGVVEVNESGCYSFVMDASNAAAPVLVVTEVSTGLVGAPATRLTGAPGAADVDPAYSNNGRFVVYSGVAESQP